MGEGVIKKIWISCDSQTLMDEVPVMNRLGAGKRCHDGLIECYCRRQLISRCLNGEIKCFICNF